MPLAIARACDNGAGYWNNTAIFITWDDWGGWYDHEPPTILAQPEGDYQYGFRVPLVVVSAYTPQGYINNTAPRFRQHSAVHRTELRRSGRAP